MPDADRLAEVEPQVVQLAGLVGKLRACVKVQGELLSKVAGMVHQITQLPVDLVALQALVAKQPRAEEYLRPSGN